ncbi:MAG TPA: hypothetical protein VL523_14325 [Terriglobia bacterium]|nr:hypothetical protein [Terriglobia bacterium]
MPKYKIRIVSDPTPQINLPAGASLTLQAFAYDDSGNPIPVDNNQVTWASNLATAVSLSASDAPDTTSCRVSAVAPGTSVVGAQARIGGQPYGQNVTVSVS